MAIIRHMRINDLQQVNGILSRAFTQGRIDDGYAFTQVPMCHPGFIEMYYHQGTDGAFVIEEGDQIRGAAFCHIWGKTGWIGPLAIVPEKHHLGLGKQLTLHATEFLKNAECTTIGLETNPRSKRNLGFYGKIGYVPSVLSIDLIKPVSPSTSGKSSPQHTIIPFSRLNSEQREKFLAQVKALMRISMPDVDLSLPIRYYDKFQQGETLLFMRNNSPIAVAVLQTVPSLVDEQNRLLRLVVFVSHPKTPDGYFTYFLEDFFHFAQANKLDRILVRTPSHSHKTFQALLENNYRVVNSDLRLTLKGYPEKINPHVFIMSRWV